MMSYLDLYFTIGVLTTSSLGLLMHEDVNPEHTVIFFGFSGLRWDSMDRVAMPALQTMKKEGMYIERKYDPFQTESLPAFVTMITGQYPEYHGMVSNRMKDIKTGYSFDLSDNDPKWWKDVQPIWIQNQKTGNKSALCYWPGHHIAFNGKKSEYSCSTDYADPFRDLTTDGEITRGTMPFADRVSRVKYWLSLNKTERPSFIGVYFEEPLKTMMKSGVNSNETRKALKLVDNITQIMMDYLHDKKLCDKINFIVAGESGATNIEKGKDIFLNDYLQNSKFETAYEIIDNGPITTIFSKVDVNDTEELRLILKNASNDMSVYNGSNLPIEFHYTKPLRTMPIILVPKEGVRINKDRTTVSPNEAEMGFPGKYESSHALFLAKGPAFKKGFYLNSLRNVDIYNLLCKALKLSPAKNAGDEKNIVNALTKERKWYVVVIKNVVKSPTRFTIAIIVALILLFTALYLIILSITKATERCRRNYGSRRFEVFTPNKAFRKTMVSEHDDKHLLEEEESDVSDLEEDLHFHIHKDSDSTDGKLLK